MYQGLVDTRSFAEADGYAVEAKDGEVEHGEADSSKTKPMLRKELEYSNRKKGKFPIFSFYG